MDINFVEPLAVTGLDFAKRAVCNETTICYDYFLPADTTFHRLRAWKYAERRILCRRMSKTANFEVSE